MLWYGMVWFCKVSYGVVKYGMVLCGMERHVMAGYGMVWQGMVWYGRVWYGGLGSDMGSSLTRSLGRASSILPALIGARHGGVRSSFQYRQARVDSHSGMLMTE